jgi:hypothetical protein
MENNPLLNKLNEKYNPDIVKKYEMMEKIRRESINIQKTNEILNRKINLSTLEPKAKIKIDELKINRQQQDLNFSKIFSKDNMRKNQLIYEKRVQEVSEIASKINISSYDELKRT